MPRPTRCPYPASGLDRPIPPIHGRASRNHMNQRQARKGLSINRSIQRRTGPTLKAPTSGGDMAVRAPGHSEPPHTRSSPGCGMEQFHHPRPVYTGRGCESRPTPQREQLLSGLTGRVWRSEPATGSSSPASPKDSTRSSLSSRTPSSVRWPSFRASEISTPVRILDGDLMRLPVEDASCDAVICSLVLCCVPRPETTLSEVKRVLRPEANCGSTSTSARTTRWSRWSRPWRPRSGHAPAAAAIPPATPSPPSSGRG